MERFLHSPILEQNLMPRLINISGLLTFAAAVLYAQQWPYYGGDAGGIKYSPLKQINKTNVTQLRAAWIFHTGEKGENSFETSNMSFECTPLVVDGVMYITTAFNVVIALEPESGRELWRFDPKLD